MDKIHFQSSNNKDYFEKHKIMVKLKILYPQKNC